MQSRNAQPPTESTPVQEARDLPLLVFRVALLMALAISTVFAVWHTVIQGEFAQAADRFGYLQMAADVRRGGAPGAGPRFTFDSAQSRLMLDFLRARGLPLDNAGAAGPNAYHYVAATDQIICQYPPGVGLMLSLLPEGRAVVSWRCAAIALLAGLGVWSCLRTGAEGGTLLAAAVMALAAMCGMLIVVLAVSYSVDMLILPLTAAAAAAWGSRRPGWAGWILVLLAGAALGWAVVVRLSAALFLPGFLVLAWSAGRGTSGVRRGAGRVAALLGAFGAGVLPLLFHQRALTGSWFHSTYTPQDASAPAWSCIGGNLAYYFAGSGSDLIWFLFAGAAALGVGIVATRKSPAWAGALPGIGAMLLWFLIPTAYFAAHKVVTPYYQFPTLFMSLLAMALILRQSGAAAQGSGDALVRTGAWILAALLLARVMLLPWPSPELERLSAQPDTTPPAALRDGRAWILADRLSGTLWYYDGIPSLRIANLDAPTRQAFFKYLQTRGEPVYLIVDNGMMADLAHELQAAGATFSEAGNYCPLKRGEAAPFTAVYRVQW